MTETVGITGASSVVAQKLADLLRKKGYNVVMLGRQSQSQFSLHPFHIHTERPLDVIVHLAWDFTTDNYRLVNYQGSQDLINWAKRNHSDFIFISSLSSFPGAKSLYGKTKYDVEEAVLQQSGVVVKPGLIYSKESPFGITGAIQRMVKRLPFLPIVCFNSVQYPVDVQDVVGKILNLIQSRKQYQGKRVCIRSSRPQLFGNYLIQQFPGKIVIRISWQLLYLALRIAEILNIPVGLRSDSLIGLAYYDQHVEDYPTC